MKYMLLFNSPPKYLERDLYAPEWKDYRDSWMSYMEAIYAAGIVKAGERLQPPYSSSMVRVQGGRRQVQDGPLPETKEMLGGFLVIDVPTLDDALVWAERSPSSADGSTEVRPIAPMPTGVLG